jgi:hypothetical protein
MLSYADEVRNDIRAEFGDSAISKFDKNAKSEISEAIAVYNSMTKDEQNAIAYLKDNNRQELHALYLRVKERAGL